jgi:lantibiotic modifying enzyme
MEANRRRFLQAAVVSEALARYRPALGAAPVHGASGTGAAADYLEPARQAAAWIRTSAIKQSAGIAWPSEPDKPETVGPDIYKGNAGTLIFFLELARASKDTFYAEEAQRAADYVIDRAVGIQGSGFNHEGLAGAAWAILQTWEATREARYRNAAVAATETLAKRAQAAGTGVTWGPAADISSGDAGIVSYLLNAARTFDRDDWRQLARRAGSHLREMASKDAGGNLYWSATPNARIVMPNFAHGTSGVATVLAQLYSETREQEYLDAALSGAAHLKSIAHSDRDTFILYHHDPDGRDLYYLGQCNGPAGSARLFYELYRNTKDKSWLDITERAAGAILKSGIPEQQKDSYPQIPLRVEYSVRPGHLPGFWNNISQCCGAAGIADFFLNLHQATGKPQYLDFARRALDNVVNRAYTDDKGYRWYQSEFRIQPWIIAAQTGYMQGAAGVGSALVHLHTALAGQYHAVLFPYNPFPHDAQANA